MLIEANQVSQHATLCKILIFHLILTNEFKLLYIEIIKWMLCSILLKMIIPIKKIYYHTVLYSTIASLASVRADSLIC